MTELAEELKTMHTNIEILGKFYPIRCKETELLCLQQAAHQLNQEMLAIKEAGKSLNLDRIAIITALNLTHKLLKIEEENNKLMQKITQRLSSLQDKIETAIYQTQQIEMG
jgi:cell division protein ZapA